MSATWNTLFETLNEASERDALISFITRKYGENEADEVRPFIEKHWNPQDLKALAQAFRDRYMDHQVDGYFERGTKKIAAPEKPKKAATSDEPQYKDPEQAAAAAAKAKEVGNMRPDRAGTKANFPHKPNVPLVPGERPQHDVGQSVRGTSPGHTRPPQVQPSQTIMPSELGRDMSNLRQQLKQLQQDPKKNSAEIAKIQQQIDRIGATGKSGVEDAQKRVDYITATYGPQMGDQQAKKLGVPTTKERTRRSREVDPRTGQEKTVVQIWNADKLMRWKKEKGEGDGADAGVYDLPGKPSLPAGEEPGSVPPAVARQRKGLEPVTAVSLEPSAAKFRKPMVKGPDGNPMVRKGDFPGQRWKPHGVSKKAVVARADQATGNFKHGSRYTDPSQEGQEVVWDGNDWILPSQWAAKRGQAKATGGS